LANASTIWLTALGAALWGLQLGVTQGLLGAAIADVAPDRLRGAAFGAYDVAIGVATFIANAWTGALWMAGGPSIAFGFSACVAIGIGSHARDSAFATDDDRGALINWCAPL
jgi:hypothetical protein